MRGIINSIAMIALAGSSTMGIASQNSSPTVDPTLSATPIPEDLALLEGKKVVVGRLALCVPNTFQPNLSYAGKTAKVVGFKANQSLSNVSVGRLPANLRAMIEDQKKGGVLVLQFEDGTKLDTCVPQGSTQLAPNLDVAPGETIAAAAAPARVVTAAAAPQSCPMAVVKISTGVSFGHLLADTLTTSELQRQIDEVNHGGAGKHYLDVQVRNDSGKQVKAFEFSAVYADKMGDDSTAATFVSQNDKPISAGAVYKASAMDRDLRMQNGSGEVNVYVARVRFDDDSYWQDNGSRSCRLKSSLK